MNHKLFGKPYIDQIDMERRRMQQPVTDKTILAGGENNAEKRLLKVESSQPAHHRYNDNAHQTAAQHVNMLPERQVVVVHQTRIKCCISENATPSGFLRIVVFFLCFFRFYGLRSAVRLCRFIGNVGI